MAEPTERCCGRCGTIAACAPGGLPEGWSIETEAKRVTYTCRTCLRNNLRAIEGKLPQEYWEY